MARIVLAPQIQADIDRSVNFLFEHTPDIANERVAAIIAAIDILATSPRIGRPTDAGKRELIIASGTGAHVALYQYVPKLDIAFVIAIRSQREAGYVGL